MFFIGIHTKTQTIGEEKKKKIKKSFENINKHKNLIDSWRRLKKKMIYSGMEVLS